MTSPFIQDAARIVEHLRTQPPLVHCVSATVSMSTVADGLLAAGARPMMTETLAEAPTMTRVAHALLINLGTLSEDATRAIEAIVAASCEAGHPWVLDPTAVGVGPVRTQIARTILAKKPAIIRGNASEILALEAEDDPMRLGGSGPDSTHSVADAEQAAQRLAARQGCVVMVSGATDVITDGDSCLRASNGHPLLARVTGTGCLLGALTAACVAVATREGIDMRAAGLASTTWLNLAAERAAAIAEGPGSFRVVLFDHLASLEPDDLETHARVSM